MKNGKLTPRELAAVLAGLRLVRSGMDAGEMPNDEDGSITDILTDCGNHAPLDADEIDTLCEELNQ